MTFADYVTSAWAMFASVVLWVAVIAFVAFAIMRLMVTEDDAETI